MEPGNLVKYEDYDGDVRIGYVMYLDTDYANDVFYRIRWDDGSETDEYYRDDEFGSIEVLQ